MATITEDYVSFETAKLLKEKGFDETCYACFEYFSSSITMYSGWPFEYKGEPVYNSKDIITCPTIQMAMKWLREEKGIAIIPILSSVLDSEKFLWDVKIVVAKTNETYSQGWIYEKYEKACEAGIKYCLKNLI